MNDHAKLQKTADDSVSHGRRTLQCNAAILEFIPPELQESVGAALKLKPMFTPRQIAAADAYELFFVTRDEFKTDDEAIAHVARELGIKDVEDVHRVVTLHNWQAVNDILRERGVLEKF